jgi:hypothetical protein
MPKRYGIFLKEVDMVKVKHVTRQEDIPKEPHWAILKFTSIVVPGYDLGDPDTSKGIVEYEAYIDEEEWKTEVRNLANPKNYPLKPYYAMQVTPADVQVNVTVAVNKK